MTILYVNHDRRADAQAAFSPRAAAPVPTRRPFQFAYIGDAELARECFARSRSVEIIEAAPGSNTTLDRLPTDARSGQSLSPDILFIEHGYPGVDTHAILRDIAARQLSLHVVIVASWDEEFAKQSFTLGAADYVTKSNASFRAVAFRMGRLMAQAAHLRAQQQAVEADAATVDVLEREVAATTLALQRAEQGAAVERQAAAVEALQRQEEFDKQVARLATRLQRAEEQHASERTEAAEQLAATKSEAEVCAARTVAMITALERTLDDTAATLSRVEQQAAADRQAATDAGAQRQATFERELTQEVARRAAAVDALEAKLRDAVDALQHAEQQHASERAESAAQLAATKRQANAQAAETRQAAIDAAAERQATFETALTAEVARREALAAQVFDLTSALAQAIERHRSEVAVAEARFADLQQQADADGQTAADAALQREAEFNTRLAAEVAERHLLANKLASAVAVLQQTERQRASENSEAAALLAATKRQAEAQAAEERQSAMDAAAERQVAFETQLTAEVARREALATQLSDVESALAHTEQRHQSETAAAAAQLDAAKRQAETLAADTAAEIDAVQRTLDDTAAALTRVERQSADDRQAAIDAAAERQAAFKTELTQEVARRAAAIEALEAKLRDAVDALQQTERQRASEKSEAAALLAATKRQAEAQAAEERQSAMDAAAERQEAFETQLTAEVARREALATQLSDVESALAHTEQRHQSETAAAAAQLDAAKRQAETLAADTAAEIDAVQHTLDDTVAALTRVERQAADDRQAAIDAAAERQAAFKTELTQEVARRSAAVEALEAKLRDAVDVLQQAEQQRASEAASAAAQLDAAKRQAEARAAAAARELSALQRTLDGTAATLSRVEQQAVADRQAAADAAAERTATFEKDLAGEVARRQALATQLSGLESASVQAEQRHHLAMAAVSAQLADQRQHADRDRQAARDAAAHRQAEYDTQLAAEVTERQRLANQLAHRVAALQRAEQQHVSEMHEAAAQLDAAKRQAEAQAAEAARELSALQRMLDGTAATLTRVEQQAADERQTAIDAAVQRQATFESELAEAVARGQALATQLSTLESAMAQAEQRHHAEMADAAARFADQQQQAETRLTNVSVAVEGLVQEAAARFAALQQDTRAQREAVEREHRRRFDHAPVSMCRCTPDGTISLANHAFARFLGYDRPEELQEVDLAASVFESAEELRWILERCLASRATESIETTWTKSDGSRIMVRVLAVAATPDSIEITPEDITTRRVLEDKLRVSQRKEAVARYASEVAVTCDNLLQHVELEGRLWLAESKSDVTRYHGELLLDEVSRAAKYLRQLTVYGNEAKKGSETVDLNKVLKDLEPVLRRVAGGDIDLVLPQGAASLDLDVEAERVERMLVTVAAFGRDRMPAGGRLMIQAAPTTVDRKFAAKYPNVRPGAHVLLTINETRGAARPDFVQAARTPGVDVMLSQANRPGVDLGTLQSLVSGCGGHLWMMAQPKGDMVLKIRLPRRVMRPEPPVTARARWIKRAASLRN